MIWDMPCLLVVLFYSNIKNLEFEWKLGNQLFILKKFEFYVFLLRSIEGFFLAFLCWHLNKQLMLNQSKKKKKKIDDRTRIREEIRDETSEKIGRKFCKLNSPLIKKCLMMSCKHAFIGLQPHIKKVAKLNNML